MLTEEQLRARLMTSATQGALAKNWKKHPMFKLYEEALQAAIDDKKQLWLKGTDEEAKSARHEARGLAKALQILKVFEISGDVAKKGLIEANENLTD